MPKFVIEREMPGIGELSPEQLRDAASLSKKVVGELGPEIHWLTSYITTDKVYCVFVAPDDEIILEHARCASFPVDRISKVAPPSTHPQRSRDPDVLVQTDPDRRSGTVRLEGQARVFTVRGRCRWRRGPCVRAIYAEAAGEQHLQLIPSGRGRAGP